jgi:small subunit ribosomal protein S18
MIKKRNQNPRVRSQQSTEVKDKKCYFCANGYKDIDYKDAQSLRRFTSSYGKIVPRRRSAVCSKHQRKLAMAIKRARVMAILPFINR